MAHRITQLIPAEGWYAVFARTSTAAREHTAAGTGRPNVAWGNAPVPEFLPLVAWALLEADSGNEDERVVGVIMHGNQQTETVATDDPSFLGYAGPGDPGVEHTGPAPD